MDKSIMSVEGGLMKSDPAASASKSVGSIVQIDSISIDINCAMEKTIEPQEFDHFSIREFVAGILEKNRETCMPFNTEGDDNHMIPPWWIPKFRWWKCSTCVADMVEGSTAVKQLAGRNNVGTSSRWNADNEKDGSISHNKQQTADEDGPRDLGCKEDHDPCNKTIVYSSQCTGECKATCKFFHEAKRIKGGSRDQTRVRDDEVRNEFTHVAEANPSQIQERHPNAAVEKASARTVESDIASLRSDHGDSASQKPRRKLRSLVDIMEVKKNSMSAKSRMGSAFSSGMQTNSTDVEADLEPRLQLDVREDIAKGAKSPQRKKKAVEEDRGQPETAKQSAASKRLKSSILSAEKTPTRVHIVESDSRGVASVPLELRENAKPLQIKPKRNKSLENRRKMRQMHIDSRTVQMGEVPKINDVHSPNLQKHISTMKAHHGNAGHVPSLARQEVEPSFPSFLSGQQMDRISDLSKGKTPVVVGSFHNPLINPCKSRLEDHNIREEVTLNLSLNSCSGVEKRSNNQVSLGQHRGIPDLNKSFTENISMLSETTSSTLPRHLEMSASSSKEKVADTQQAAKNTDSNVETGRASDDIPMDIVELLARNQRERELGSSQEQLPPKGINNSVRVSSASCADKHSGTVNFAFASGTSTSVARVKTTVTQGTSNFTQVKKCPIGLGNMKDSQFKLFGSFTQSQQYPVSSLAPRQNEGTDLLWPPRQKNVPFHPSVTPIHSIQPNILSLHSSAEGTVVDSVKGEQKSTLWKASAVKERRTGSSSTVAYSNETIPAMQLLSLMDQGIPLRSSFKVGPNSFPDRHLTPCNHHPRPKGNENRNNPFLNASLFSQNTGVPMWLNGDYFFSESLKKTHPQGQTPPEQGSSKTVLLDTPSTAVARPSNNDQELGVCTLNRNPADTATPDKGNEFTISYKDLRPRKSNASRQRTRPGKAGGRKRQRARRNSSK